MKSRAERLDAAENALLRYLSDCAERARTEFPPAYPGDTPVHSVNPTGDVTYKGIWPDDFTIPVRAGELLTNEELSRIMEFLTDAVVDLPFFPDMVQMDGTPNFAFGGDCWHTATHMTLAMCYSWTLLLSYMESRGVVIPQKRDWLELFRRSLRDIPFSCGLVYANPSVPPVTYPFHDIVASTGLELMSSVYTCHGLEMACELYRDVATQEERDAWMTRANKIRKNLPRLFDFDRGIYLAGSQDCRQPDIWGSGLAAGLSSTEKRAAIADFYMAHYEDIFREGMTRPTENGEGWQRLHIAFGKGEYMNGGFWARGTAYVLPVLYEFYPDVALDLLEQLVVSLEKYQFPECISANDGTIKCPCFLMGIAPNIFAVRAMKQGKQLLDMI